jgi:hypothetical protein
MEDLTQHLPWNKEERDSSNLERRISKILVSLGLMVCLILPIRGSLVDPALELEQIRAFSREYEFDYVTWTLSALKRKLLQSSLGINHYLSKQDGNQLVRDYIGLRNRVNQVEGELSNAISDPNLEDRDEYVAQIRKELELIQTQQVVLAPYVEQVLQDQLNKALADLGMSLGGQLLPPVLYRSEPNSSALIVSPRNEIRQAANLMLIRGMSIDEIIQLEEAIESNLDLSALVVGIGGVGLYPSMIIESGNLDWLIHVIGHEWTHNYLTLRPLGAHYNASPEIKTINETIADLSADEIQLMVYSLYYPELLPSEPELEPEEIQAPEEVVEPEVPEFDFRAEMHITRLEVDRLLSEGEIERAEEYMEERRVFFWENGYLIRKLNQAYFAFHGSYAADPGGAADEEGADLGEQLRQLKSRSTSYRSFMRLVAWRWKLEQFQELFETYP